MNTKHFLLFLLLLPFGITSADTNQLPIYNLDDYVVQSSPLSLDSSEITQSSTVIEGTALDNLRSDTIAQTLSEQPGISQTFYGPNATRPIIRGLQGYRVNILENGVSAFDLSASSNDHSVTINPLLVDRIEIIRGASALIHGANSIGGIVNIFDNSIPAFGKGTNLTSEFTVSSGGVGGGLNSSAILYHQKGNFLFQINGSSTSSSDYKVPSFQKHDDHEHHHHSQFGQSQTTIGGVTSVFIPEEDEGESDEEEEESGDEENEVFEVVHNTHSKTNTFGFGGSYNHDKGFIGFSVSDYNSEYGVPNHEDSVVSIQREKISLESLYNFDTGFFDSMHLQLAYGDYAHSEDAGHEEGDSDVTYYEIEGGDFEAHGDEHGDEHGDDHHGHANFLYEGIDSKVVFAKSNDSSATALSLSFTDFDMKIEGEESYLSATNHFASENHENEEYLENNPTIGGIIAESTNRRIENDSTKRYGIGFMHMKDLSTNLSVNGGVRYEKSTRNYDALTRGSHDVDPIANDFKRDDSTINASIGFVSDSTESITFSGNLHYAERIPETSELYSSGAHHATESFEIGDPDLDNEESIGVEFAISNTEGAFDQKLSIFFNKYDNFIFQSGTGFVTGTNMWREATSAERVEALEEFDELEENGEPIYVRANTEDDGFEELSIREYKGVEAEIYGLEYSFNYQIDSNSYISGFADSITGNDVTNDISLPRIPPYRLGLAYHLNAKRFNFKLDGIYSGKQNDLGVGEETTDSYTLFNARLGYSISDKNNSEIYCKMNNLTDELAFSHTSFLKESAPLPGRNFEIGLNIQF